MICYVLDTKEANLGVQDDGRIEVDEDDGGFLGMLTLEQSVALSTDCIRRVIDTIGTIDPSAPINDVLGLVSLYSRVRKLSHVLKMGDGNVLQALHKLLDLVESGNNLRQLQAWSRFAWVFGRANTETADHCLTKLIEFSRTRRRAAALLDSLPKWSFRARGSALREALQAAQHCEVLLDHIDDNEREAQALQRQHDQLNEEAKAARV